MHLVAMTGMHRSGTSLTARWANLLGVHLGGQDDLAGPAPDNPRGFWEHEACVALNEEILLGMGGPWSDPPTLAPGWEHVVELSGQRERAAALLLLLGSGHPIAGFKDPRTSLTLPLWRAAGPVTHSIMCVREPREVVASLQRRNGFGTEHGARLWVRYTTAAHLHDPERLLVPYEQALMDPDGTLDRMADHLGLARPTANVRARARAFADPGMRHHRTAIDEAPRPGSWMAAAVELHRALTSAPPAHADAVVRAAAVRLGEPTSAP